MGCGASSGISELAANESATHIVSNQGKQAKASSSHSPTAISRKADNWKDVDYNPIAIAAANPAAVTTIDYRGLNVIMVNATQSKVNSICLWADTVLGIREKNGGLFGEPPGEGTIMSCSEASLCGDDGAPTIRPEAGSFYQNRLEVSVYNTGELPTLRYIPKSQVALPFDKSQSLLLTPRKHNTMGKSDATEMSPGAEGLPSVKLPVGVDMPMGIKKMYATEGPRSADRLGGSDSFGSLKKLQGDELSALELKTGKSPVPGNTPME